MSPPSASRSPSSTARLAVKKAHGNDVEPALFRRTVHAVASVNGCGLKTARQRVQAWLAGGAAASDLEAWLRLNYRVDPVGVTATRNVQRARGW